MNFSLIPFRAGCPVTALTGEIALKNGLLEVRWCLKGDANAVIWPDRHNPSGRTMGLWEHTCLEVFLGPADALAYYEINLSPAGDWNAFSFTNVREGMVETAQVTTLSSSKHRDRDGNVSLDATFRLDGLLTTPLRIGLSAVIEDSDNRLHYFALAHQARPDFHRRDNHILILDRE